MSVPEKYRNITIGFSPCPNDTFIFDALVNGKIDTAPFRFEAVLEDVETLNQWALKAALPVTKISYSTFLNATDHYWLMDSGSALGSGVGPLLVGCQQPPDPAHLAASVENASIAIPGANTTANLLLTLAYPGAQKKSELLFSEIEQGVRSGRFDLGLLIHEGRFTYRQRGLKKWMDMGAWWEQKSGAAIPLGGIAVRKDVPKEIARQIDGLLKKSIRYSWQHYPELAAFVIDNAQEMEESVMRQHIELYVNQYTASLGAAGQKAIDTLFQLAFENGLIPAIPDSIYLSP